MEEIIQCLTEYKNGSQLTSKLCEIIRLNWDVLCKNVKTVLKNNGWSGEIEGQFNGPILHPEKFLSRILDISEEILNRIPRDKQNMPTESNGGSNFTSALEGTTWEEIEECFNLQKKTQIFNSYQNNNF